MNATYQKLSGDLPIEARLKVSRYDQAASLLVSLLILIGAGVAVLLTIWMTMTLEVRLHKTTITRGEKPKQTSAAGFVQDMETLGRDEIPELTEPQLAAELQAVSDAVATLAATHDTLETAAILNGPGKPGGDGRSDIGEDDEEIDSETIPRGQRWQIRWTSTSPTSYTRQLDYFDIELGAAGGRPMVDYVTKLGAERPSTRKGAGKAETRLYMTWQGGTLRQFDSAIMARAQIPTTNRLILHFYPPEVEERLAELEMEFAAQRGHADANAIRKTYFGVRPLGTGFEFYVEDQQFRAARP